MLDLLLPAGRPLRVLAIGAHCDDIEIGAGGLLLSLIEARPDTEVCAQILTSTPERGAEARNALADLCAPVEPEVHIAELVDSRLPAAFDEVKDILGRWSAQAWDLVLTPHADDAHQDHSMIGRLAPTAFRDHLVLQYEIIKWDGDLGRLRPNVYVPLTEAQVRRRWEIIDGAYGSQRAHDWWSAETFSSLARLRGVECRSRYAEAFRASKLTLDLHPHGKEHG